MTTTQPNSKDQLARLLVLVPYLYAHAARGGVTVEEAASLLGVSHKQVLRDLKVLWMCGLPGGLPDDLIDVDLEALEGPDADGLIRISNADYLARPLRLRPTEAVALIVALRALRSGANPETREIVDAVLAKLENAAASGSASQVDLSDEQVGGPDPAPLASAIANGRQVRLVYYVPARDEESERIVDPHRLVNQEGATYLDAWCHSAEAKRSFRLDRIREATVLDTTIAIEPDETTLADGIFEIGESQVVTLRLDEAARWVPEYYPVLASRDVGDGSLEVDLAYADERWLHRLLLRLAPYAEVIQPVELSAPFVQMAREALAHYDHDVDSTR